MWGARNVKKGDSLNQKFIGLQEGPFPVQSSSCWWYCWQYTTISVSVLSEGIISTCMAVFQCKETFV